LLKDEKSIFDSKNFDLKIHQIQLRINFKSSIKSTLIFINSTENQLSKFFQIDLNFHQLSTIVLIS